MQSFIVLGIIPGTNIQTTLNFWIVVACLLLALAFLPQIVLATTRLQRYLVARKIARTINRFDLIAI